MELNSVDVVIRILRGFHVYSSILYYNSITSITVYTLFTVPCSTFEIVLRVVSLMELYETGFYFGSELQRKELLLDIGGYEMEGGRNAVTI